MSVEIIFETHAMSEDNESGNATGWLPGRLSDDGRTQAELLGKRRRGDGLSAVLTSDLKRARDTAELAFGTSPIPILADWRLRECDYGELNGAPVSQVHGAARYQYLNKPYPNGESWEQAVARVAGVLPEIAIRWAGRRVLIIGHKATGWALRHAIENIAVSQLLNEDFGMPRGRHYVLEEIALGFRPIAAWHRNSDQEALGS